MAVETAPDPSAQATIEMPGGVTMTGIGGDVEALREQFEERREDIQPEAAPVAATPEAPAKEPRGRKRYGQLTHERDEAIQRASVAEARAKELEARLTPQPVQPQVPVASPQPVAVVPATRPEPTEEEVGVKYSTYSAFVKDLAAWTVEQERAKLLTEIDARSTRSIEAERASRTRLDFVQNTVFPAGKTAYPDFDTVLKASTKIIPYAIQEAILKLPNPEHAIYALAKNDAQVDALADRMSDPIALGIAIAQLMPREPVASPASTAPVVRTTNAPTPIQPVGAGTRTTSPTAEELANKGEYEAYKQLRAAQRKA